MKQSGTLTLLITGIVNPTELLDRNGDESGRQLFRAHHKQLSDAISACGGEELEWLGQGIVASFTSAADAVRCAIQMQQATSRPVAGVRIAIRIGMHVGELLRGEDRFFGVALDTARALCDQAESGQILCTRLIANLLSSRGTFKFRELGLRQVKGVANPLPLREVVYERSDPTALLKRTPFVGRSKEVNKLQVQLESAAKGRGAVVTLAGEAGIGKTRIIEEFAEVARDRGAQVLRGACYGDEWHAPYGPFAEILVSYARKDSGHRLKAIAGTLAASLVRIAPGLRAYIEIAEEPLAADKDEERHRMVDAMLQFLIGVSRDAPLAVVLDDLHWADRGTVAMLQQVARMVDRNPILLVAAYRESEIDPKHPLATVLASLRRLPVFENLSLRGLTSDAVRELLEIVGGQNVPEALVQAVGNETEGNPFFIRELLLYLRESSKIPREEKGWLARFSVEKLAIPESIKQLIDQRLARLSDEANRFLAVGSAFKGACVFSVAATVAGLDEDSALRAVDEAIAAHILRPGSDPENLEFTHAIIRHTLYSNLNPARRSRLHQKIAETMEGTWGERAAEHAADVAYQFWLSRAPSRTDRGAEYAIAAANNAEVAYAYDDVVAFLRIALELTPEGDSRRTRILARLGTSLVWTVEREESSKVVLEAADLIARTEGNSAAADYVESAAVAMFNAGLRRLSWKMAQAGLKLIENRRDVVWASLRELDLMREEAEDPNNPGMRADTPGQRELRAFLRSLPEEQTRTLELANPYESREEIIRDPTATPAMLLFLAADCRRSLPMWRASAARAEQEGRIARAARYWANIMTCHVTLGEFAEARAAGDRSLALTARAAGPSKFVNIDLMGARHDLRIALDEGWQEAFEDGTSELFFDPNPEQNSAFAMTCSNGAYLATRMNIPDQALQVISILPAALERGAPWEATYTAVACDAAAVLWYLNRTDLIDVVERSLRDKVMVSDFRWPMRDARLALGRLCALRGDYEHAGEWFDRARSVLDQAGHQPLRAIVDYDQGTMYQRRGAPGDSSRACEFLEIAAAQFRRLSMTGWILRVEEGLSHV